VADLRAAVAAALFCCWRNIDLKTRLLRRSASECGHVHPPLREELHSLLLLR